MFAYFNEDALLGCKTWACAGTYAKDNLYIFGYELLPINGLITFIGLYLSRIRPN